MLQQAFTGILNQAQCQIEVFVIAGVGIRHFLVFVKAAKRGQRPQLVSMRRRALAVKVLEVVVIHVQQQIGRTEIGFANDTSAQIGQINTALRGKGNGTVIGRPPRVVVVGACGIDHHAVEQTRVAQLLTKHAMGRGAAANVAHANENNSEIHDKL
jgi:hypothetical protein